MIVEDIPLNSARCDRLKARTAKKQIKYQEITSDISEHDSRKSFNEDLKKALEQSKKDNAEDIELQRAIEQSKIENNNQDH